MQIIMLIFNCLDGNIILNQQQFDKFKILPFFKEVVRLDSSDELDINIRKKDFQLIVDFICDDKIPEITVKNFKELLNYSKFYQLDILEANIRRQLPGLFTTSCRLGNLDDAKKIFYFVPGGSPHKRMLDCAFRRSCKYGHLEVAQWLYGHGADIHAINYKAFQLSCIRGHLDVAQWLFRLSQGQQVKILITHSPFLWRICCNHGHLHVAQWLFHKRLSKKLNLTASFGVFKDEAFFESCQHGHLHVAQWLLYESGLQLKFDIPLIRKIFRSSCVNGHLHVAKWLYSLFRLEYYFDDFPNYLDYPEHIRFWMAQLKIKPSRWCGYICSKY